MDLDGKAALVVGGSGGLGRVVAGRLASAGARVTITFRSGHERAAAVAEDLRAAGAMVETARIDVTDETSIADCLDHAVRAMGGLDILVHAAGIARGATPVAVGDLEGFTSETFDRLIAVNLRGPFLLARAAAPYLAAGEGGRIVNIGSTIGLGRWGAEYPYSISKASVVPLTRYLAQTLGPEVLVNCVAPGLMEGTVMSADAPEDFVTRWRDAAASGRTTSLDDVAEQVLACCRTDTMTGQTVIVDGGLNFH